MRDSDSPPRGDRAGSCSLCPAVMGLAISGIFALPPAGTKVKPVGASQPFLSLQSAEFRNSQFSFETALRRGPLWPPNTFLSFLLRWSFPSWTVHPSRAWRVFVLFCFVFFCKTCLCKLNQFSSNDYLLTWWSKYTPQAIAGDKP